MPDVFIKLRKFEAVYNFVYSVFMLICKLLLVADILITSWIVLARYIKVIPCFPQRSLSRETHISE